MDKAGWDNTHTEIGRVRDRIAVDVQETCLQRLQYGARGTCYRDILADQLQPDEERTLKEANDIFQTCNWVGGERPATYKPGCI